MFMTWKSKIMTMVFALLVTVTVIMEIQVHKTYPWQLLTPNYQLLSHTPPEVKIVSAKYPRSSGGWVSGGDGLLGLNQSAAMVVQHAFGDSPRIILSAKLPAGSYDFISNVRSDDYVALRQEIKRKWGITARSIACETNVVMLRVKSSSLPNLKLSTEYPHYISMLWNNQRNRLTCRNSSLGDCVKFIEVMAHFPVVDETGLAGFYDFDLNCREKSIEEHDWDSVNQGLNELGLELVVTNMPIEMRLIENVK